MVQLISKEKAEEVLVNYIDLLMQTGYVRAGMVRKMLLYTFLIDFVEYMHAFIDENDYKLIENLLAKLFSGGNCLLPYPVFCTKCATLGSTDYMTDFATRITEVLNGEDDRISEENIIRTTNGYYGDKRYAPEETTEENQ